MAGRRPGGGLLARAGGPVRHSPGPRHHRGRRGGRHRLHLHRRGPPHQVRRGQARLRRHRPGHLLPGPRPVGPAHHPSNQAHPRAAHLWVLLRHGRRLGDCPPARHPGGRGRLPGHRLDVQGPQGRYVWPGGVLVGTVEQALHDRCGRVGHHRLGGPRPADRRPGGARGRRAPGQDRAAANRPAADPPRAGVPADHRSDPGHVPMAVGPGADLLGFHPRRTSRSFPRVS